MQVVGDGAIQMFDAEDECPHLADEQEMWQESFVIYFWDPVQKVYLFFRISQVPNRRGGIGTAWLSVWTPEYLYKKTDELLPLSEAEITSNSIMVGNGLCKYSYDGQHKWRLHDDDVEVTLTMTDQYPGMAYFKDKSSALDNVLKNHIETTGDVTGIVRIKNKQYSVSGKAWRDHSWGNRDWNAVRCHRAFHAIFDDLSVFSLVHLGSEGKLTKNAIVVRDEKVHFTQDFLVTTYMDEDGITNVGGRMDLTFAGKQQFLEFKPVGRTVIHMTEGFACVDCLCHISMGDKVGVGFVETSTRPQGGTKTPHVFTPGQLENGLFPVSGWSCHHAVS